MAYILGGGPSLNLVDIGRLRGERIIAVNNAYRLADWIDVMYFGDGKWLGWHMKELVAWPGLKVTTCESHKKYPWLCVVEKRNSPWGITTNPWHLCWNLNSGSCAINLAVHFGVSKIVLLGFDMRRVEGKANWHDDHKNGAKKEPYERHMKPFPDIARDLERLNVECINATPGSALTHFPIVDPEEVLPKPAEVIQ